MSAEDACPVADHDPKQRVARRVGGGVRHHVPLEVKSLRVLDVAGEFVGFSSESALETLQTHAQHIWCALQAERLARLQRHYNPLDTRYRAPPQRARWMAPCDNTALTTNTGLKQYGLHEWAASTATTIDRAFCQATFTSSHFPHSETHRLACCHTN